MKRLMIVSLIVLLGALNRPSYANTPFVVNSVLDEVDANPGDGVCASTPSGVCTLRAALNEANALAGDDTIQIPAGTYVLTIAGMSENAGLTGDLDITDEVSLSGASAATTIVDGNHLDRVFEVVSDVISSIQNITIRNGRAIPAVGYGAGGGIQNYGRLTVSNSLVFSNTASGTGGGVANYKAITLTASTLQKNYAEYGGGGIYSSSGPALLRQSAVISNAAGSTGGTWGGGFWAYGRATLVNTTVSGNTGGVNGLRSSGTITLLNSTVANTNGIVAPPPSDRIYMQNTIIADLCSGSSANLISLGYNYLNNCTITGTTTGNITGNPNLGALQDNGGPTLTHMIPVGNAAINGGNPAGCVDATGSLLLIDQRGIGRPRGSYCDIGALERILTCDPTAAGSGLTFKLYLPLIARSDTLYCP